MNTDHRGEADTYLHSDNLDFLEFEQDFSGLRNLRGGEEEKKKKSALDSILFPPCVILSYISFNQLVQHQVKVSRRATRSEVRFLHNLSYQTAQYPPDRGSLGTKTSDNYSLSCVPCSVSECVALQEASM